MLPALYAYLAIAGVVAIFVVVYSYPRGRGRGRLRRSIAGSILAGMAWPLILIAAVTLVFAKGAREAA